MNYFNQKGYLGFGSVRVDSVGGYSGQGTVLSHTHQTQRSLSFWTFSILYYIRIICKADYLLMLPSLTGCRYTYLSQLTVLLILNLSSELFFNHRGIAICCPDEPRNYKLIDDANSIPFCENYKQTIVKTVIRCQWAAF